MVDTKQKRFSAVYTLQPWRGAAIVPAGAVDQAERQASVYLYSGILASPPTPPSTGSRNSVVNRIRHISSVAVSGSVN